MYVKWLTFICFLVKFSEQCVENQYPFEGFLATKTPYRLVGNRSFDEINYEGCEPTKLWIIIRHGTRNPSVDQIQQAKQNLPKIRDAILSSVDLPNSLIHNRDLDSFKNWKNKVKEEDAKKLRAEGEEEMILIAERMQSRFPKILDSVYSNTSYNFKFTDSQRTKKSAFYFTTGLFGKSTSKDVWYPTPSKKDPILRFYKLCKKWRSEVKERPIKELIDFKQSIHMKKVIQNVNKRLGINNINRDNIHVIYQTCAYETAWNKNKKSPWCSLFSVDDLKVMQYYEDLKYYWVDGYGHNLTHKQACQTFNEMINFIDSEEKYPKSTIYFTHSGTLLKLLAHVGLYEDTKPLTAEDFKVNDNRKWKTNKIDSFATNLAFVTFKCGEEKKLLTLHQENIVRIPACPDEDLCEISKVKEFYDESINNCDFNSICEL